jgi:hypothetical protein
MREIRHGVVVIIIDIERLVCPEAHFPREAAANQGMSIDRSFVRLC